MLETSSRRSSSNISVLGSASSRLLSNGATSFSSNVVPRRGTTRASRSSTRHRPSCGAIHRSCLWKRLRHSSPAWRSEDGSAGSILRASEIVGLNRISFCCASAAPVLYLKAPTDLAGVRRRSIYIWITFLSWSSGLSEVAAVVLGSR